MELGILIRTPNLEQTELVRVPRLVTPGWCSLANWEEVHLHLFTHENESRDGQRSAAGEGWSVLSFATNNIWGAVNLHWGIAFGSGSQQWGGYTLFYPDRFPSASPPAPRVISYKGHSTTSASLQPSFCQFIHLLIPRTLSYKLCVQMFSAWSSFNVL